MAEHDLRDLGRVGGEDAEAVVPEPAGQDEAAVHRHHEAGVAHADALTEVVAQVATDLRAENKKAPRVNECTVQ